MRILVLGATGPTGLELIRQALGNGVEVTAVVRSPGKLGDLAGQVQVVASDVFDVDRVAAASAGCRAAVCVIGAPAGFLSRGTTDVYSRAARTLTEALPRAGVSRLLFCTSAGVEKHDPGELLPYRLIAKPLFLQRAYDDMSTAEAIVRESDVQQWTLVRPGRLTEGRLTGRYRVSPRLRPRHGINLSRADLASFLLEQVDSEQWVGQTPTLTN